MGKCRGPRADAAFPVSSRRLRDPLGLHLWDGKAIHPARQSQGAPEQVPRRDLEGSGTQVRHSDLEYRRCRRRIEHHGRRGEGVVEVL